MIVPGVGAKVLIALRPVDFRKGIWTAWRRWCARHWGRDPFGGGDLRFPQQARRSGQAAVLGRHGGWCWRPSDWKKGSFRWPSLRDGVMRLDASAIVGAAGGPRLGAGARGENAGAEEWFPVITIICGKRLIL